MTTRNEKNNQPFIKGEVQILNRRSQELTISLENDNKYWTKEYIDECIQKEEDQKKRIYFTLLWKTGLRVTESLNIRKKDFDFQKQILKIRWLKNRKIKERYIPLHHTLIDIMRLYISTYLSEDKIFPWSRQNSYRMCQNIFRGNPHKLRHSFAVHWIMQGGQIYILSKMLGHSSIKTTEQEYLNIIPIDQGKELNKIIF